MNLVALALRRPISMLVLVVATVIIGLIAASRMPRDIFPDLGVPVLYVAQPYAGMDPAQMEGFLVSYYEYHFLFITGIEHVESKSIEGTALIKLQFHPGTDMSRAMAETVSYVNRARAYMPPGTVPPFVMRFDEGSVPVGNLVFSSETLDLKELEDAALFKVRPLLSTLPGVSALVPFGGAPRTVVIRADPDRLRAYNMAPDELVAALAAGNAISPSGNVRIGDKMPIVPVNSVAQDISRFRDIPIRADGNRTIFMRDVASIADSTDVQTSYALVNGRRTVYIPVTKRADASTLDVVRLVKQNMDHFQSVLPAGATVEYRFDQSPYVIRAISGLSEEGLLGAALTGIMVLLFLRDWRSALVVVLNIPLAILAALAGLWLTGQTVNLMTLGGLALAVGILVDEATVTIENIHSHLHHGQPGPAWKGASFVARAARDATSETTVPRMLAMLCVLAVFIPTLFMRGSAKNLFIPLALSVGFSMVASYILSSTFVPAMAIWLVHPRPPQSIAHRPSAFERFRARYDRFAHGIARGRLAVIPIYLAAAGLAIFLVGRTLGREIFPIVNSGQMLVRLHAPAGTRLERTEEIAQAALNAVAREVGPDKIDITLAFVGVHSSSYPVNAIFLWTAGPEDAVLQFKFKAAANVSIDKLQERLRSALPGALPGVQVSFEPSDIISRVMSFGAPTPIELAVSGPDFATSRPYAEHLAEVVRKIPTLRDVHIQQELQYPAVRVNIDRQRAGVLGVTATDVSRSLVEATSSSRLTNANFWADPVSGVAYRVQVQVPPQRMDSIEQVRNVPIGHRGDLQLSLRSVADVTEGSVPGEYDRYNMQRMLTVSANVHGEDLGRAAARVRRAMIEAGDPPRGITVSLRGQVEPMRDMFGGMNIGLGAAIVVIFMLLTFYFQSWRLALAVVLTVPAVVLGVAVALWLTRTTLNVESFMGTIMAIGVAVANAILLITFAERRRVAGDALVDAAAHGASGRLRPILMTTCAMVVGMIPMSLGVGGGGSQTAPLGRAVIGGLLGGVVATLLILPAAFALLQKQRSHKTASIDPDDPEGRYYIPADAHPAHVQVLADGGVMDQSVDPGAIP